MPTPSIQTLRADAQQVLNLDSISAVRSVVAATLANANAGTPLNPNLTTQQLWNEFYQIVTQPKSDIESIIANQLMKFMYAPPAPGGAGADQQVIFNDGGVLAGDPQFLWNKTTNLLTVTGSATITGDLTVDTSTLKVDSANNRVGIGTASPSNVLTVRASDTFVLSTGGSTGFTGYSAQVDSGAGTSLGAFANSFGWVGTSTNHYLEIRANNIAQQKIEPLGVFTWYDGAGGTRMTLNSTGLGVGGSPATGVKLHVGGGNAHIRNAAGGQTKLIFGPSVNSVEMGGVIYDDTDGTVTFGTIQNYATRFITNNTERGRFDSSGNLLVGTTGPLAGNAAKLHLSTDSGTTRWAVGPYSAATSFIISAVGGSGVYLNGTAATSWTSASDERLKDIIEPISNAVSKIASLRAVIGKFKFDENNTRKPFLIAQDIQAVLPEAVDASNPDRLGVAYTDVIPLLVAAIQELTAEVNALKNA